MRLLIIKFLLILAISLVSNTALADLSVVLIDESSLPYNLSPSNYENSPSNYDNSSSNYDSSESNYNNSASNYDNSRNGTKRLIFKDGGSLKFAGYYVIAKNGITNYFSPHGKRIFYNPRKGRGIFDSKNGNFCGVLTRVDGELSLALTELGAKILLLSE